MAITSYEKKRRQKIAAATIINELPGGVLYEGREDETPPDMVGAVVVAFGRIHGEPCSLVIDYIPAGGGASRRVALDFTDSHGMGVEYEAEAVNG